MDYLCLVNEYYYIRVWAIYSFLYASSEVIAYYVSKYSDILKSKIILVQPSRVEP